MTVSILEPSLNDDFALREETNRFLTLGMQDSKKGVFHSAEGEEGHRCHNPNVDAHVTARYIVLKFSGALAVLCEDRMAVPKGAIITYLDSLI